MSTSSSARFILVFVRPFEISTFNTRSYLGEEEQREKEMAECGSDRTVGVAVDFSPCSKVALKWALENVVRKGDHLILVTVQKEVHYEEGETQLWEATGSPFIPLVDFSSPNFAKKYGVKIDAETLDILNASFIQKEIVVVMKIYWGDARDKILEAVDKIPLTCLIIGSRGLSNIRRVLLGSVSNFVVNNASCPVTVVKHQERET